MHLAMGRRIGNVSLGVTLVRAPGARLCTLLSSRYMHFSSSSCSRGMQLCICEQTLELNSFGHTLHVPPFLCACIAPARRAGYESHAQHGQPPRSPPNNGQPPRCGPSLRPAAPRHRESREIPGQPSRLSHAGALSGTDTVAGVLVQPPGTAQGPRPKARRESAHWYTDTSVPCITHWGRLFNKLTKAYASLGYIHSTDQDMP